MPRWGRAKKPSAAAALAAFVPRALAGALGLSLVTFVLWAATADDPLGGEPTALVAVDPGRGQGGGRCVRAGEG